MPGVRARSSSTTSTENRPCTEQWPFHRIIRAVAQRLGRDAAAGLPRVPHDAVVERHPELEHRGVAAEVLVGEEQHLRVRLLLERPLQRHVGVARRTHRAAVAAAERLDVGARSSCR